MVPSTSDRSRLEAGTKPIQNPHGASPLFVREQVRRDGENPRGSSEAVTLRTLHPPQPAHGVRPSRSTLSTRYAPLDATAATPRIRACLPRAFPWGHACILGKRVWFSATRRQPKGLGGRTERASPSDGFPRAKARASNDDRRVATLSKSRGHSTLADDATGVGRVRGRPGKAENTRARRAGFGFRFDDPPFFFKADEDYWRRSRPE